jgi:hypothetical protein
MEITAGVSEDGRQARIQLGWSEVATLGPVEMEATIWNLVAARAAMQPPRRPTCFASMRIVLGDGLHAENDVNGKLLAVHHPGLGWVGVTVSKEDETLITNAFTTPPASPIIWWPRDKPQDEPPLGR